MNPEIKYVLVARASYSLGYPDSDVIETEEFEGIDIKKTVIIKILIKRWLISLGFKDPETDDNLYFQCSSGSPSEEVTIDLYPCIKVMGSLYKLTSFEIDNN